MRADIDAPTFEAERNGEWERKVRGALVIENVGQVGVPRERTPEPTPPDPLRWTRMPPTSEGWWWARTNGGVATPVYVERVGFALYAPDDCGHACDVRGLWQCEWSSEPIREPVG